MPHIEGDQKKVFGLGLLLALAFFGILIFSFAHTSLKAEFFPLLVLLSPIVILITILNTDIAIVLLIFSMLLSPEFKFAQVPQRAVVVRLDDIILITVFLAWFAKVALNKELGLVRKTPPVTVISLYILICVTSTVINILAGNIVISKSFFYILKYFEYFMLYVLVSNQVREDKQVKMYMVFFLIVGFLVSAYAFLQIGAMDRTSTPFEGGLGEANTLGGYLVLLFSICMGFFLYAPAPWNLAGAFLALFLFPPFLFSLSRGSYIAIIFSYLSLIALSARKKKFLIFILALVLLVGPLIVPHRVADRVQGTFINPQRTYHVFGRTIALDESAATRVESWKVVIKKIRKVPLLGKGITGVGLVDTQYPLVLGELGIVGFLVFFWLLATLFFHALGSFLKAADDWKRGLILGYLAGFIGLVVHGFSANTFIIVRIMEPFWFMTAIIMVISSVSPSSAEVSNAR